MRQQKLGKVYLIGGGPGDPELLTLRALRLLRQADVVLYDRLISPDVLALAQPDARRIDVGKRPQLHPVPQSGINELLIELAQAGRRVARLKGGDPFIFGRGGEELEALLAAGIPFEVVPGITAASGCAAYAGIPLTHRDHAQACVFVTGHRRSEGPEPDYSYLARPNQTVVFYMGLQMLPDLCAGLQRHGAPGSRPVAIIERGTTAQQRVVRGTLATMPALAQAAGAKAPAIVIVGDVVRLQEKLGSCQPDRVAAARS